MIVSILWLLGVIFSLGAAVNVLLLKDNKLTLERIILMLSFGLVAFVFVTMIFNLVHIPLHWGILLIISFVLILAVIYKLYKIKVEYNRLNQEFIYSVLAILIAIILTAVMLKGSYVYEWLEDDDPYDHAVAAKYISEHKTAVKSMEQFQAYGRFYMEPYPPAFPIVMGMTHQLNDSVSDTLKIVNAILLGFAVLFFYIFANELFKSRLKAVLATFVIACTPSFMSHFIWSQTLAIALMFPAFYCLIKINKIEGKKQYKWIGVGAVCVASIMMAQPSAAALFGIMFCLLWVAQAIANRNLNTKIIVVGVIGVLLSLAIFWGPILAKYGFEESAEGIGLSKDLFTDKKLDTSGGKVYLLKDFMIAPKASKIDQPTGLGLFIFAGIILGCIILIKKYRRDDYVTLMLFLWMIFTFVGVEGNALPIKLFPHRFWAFMAIPVALIVAEGGVEFAKNKIGKIILISILTVGIIFTSAIPKYVVQTSMWPAGGNFMSMEQIDGYVWMKNNLEPNTPIYMVCGNEEKAIGFDMQSFILDMDLHKFKNENNTPQEIIDFTTKFKYKYILVDISCVKELGANTTNTFLTSLFTTPALRPVHQTEHFWLFKRGDV